MLPAGGAGGGTTGLLTRHLPAALQPLEGAALRNSPQDGLAGVRAETEPSDKNLEPEPSRGSPNR